MNPGTAIATIEPPAAAPTFADLRDACTKFEQRFAEELVAGDWKIGATYGRLRPESKRPDVAGSKLLARPRVKAYADLLHSMIASRLNIDGTRVLRELGRLAFANMQDFINPATGALIPPHRLDREAAAAIQEMTVEERKVGRGKARTTIRQYRYKLAPKHGPLTTIAEHFNILSPDRQLPQNPTGGTVTTNNFLIVADGGKAARAKIEKALNGISSRMEPVGT